MNLYIFKKENIQTKVFLIIIKGNDIKLWVKRKCMKCQGNKWHAFQYCNCMKVKNILWTKSSILYPIQTP